MISDEEYVVSKQYKIEDFLKPECPVKIGDKFYKNYHVPNTLNFAIVEEIEEKKDDDGIYYIITARFPNLVVGANVKKFSSRMFVDGAYTVIRKGGKA